MKIFFYPLVLILCGCSCNQTEERTSGKSAVIADATSQSLPGYKATVPANKYKKNVQHGNEIDVEFSAGTTSVTVQGNMDSLEREVICNVPVTGGNIIKGTLATMNSASNIRFNQVTMPDGKTDGPFGKELNYLITQKGTYRIKIAPGGMAENPYYGEFLVKLYIK